DVFHWTLAVDGFDHRFNRVDVQIRVLVALIEIPLGSFNHEVGGALEGWEYRANVRQTVSGRNEKAQVSTPDPLAQEVVQQPGSTEINDLLSYRCSHVD